MYACIVGVHTGVSTTLWMRPPFHPSSFGRPAQRLAVGRVKGYPTNEAVLDTVRPAALWDPACSPMGSRLPPCAPGCHPMCLRLPPCAPGACGGRGGAAGRPARRDAGGAVRAARRRPLPASPLVPAATRGIQSAAPCNPACSPVQSSLQPHGTRPAPPCPACSLQRAPPPACRPVFIHLCYDIKNGFNRKGQLSMAVWLAQPGWLQVRAPPSVVVRG